MALSHNPPISLFCITYYVLSLLVPQRPWNMTMNCFEIHKINSYLCLYVCVCVLKFILNLKYMSNKSLLLVPSWSTASKVTLKNDGLLSTYILTGSLVLAQALVGLSQGEYFLCDKSYLQNILNTFISILKWFKRNGIFPTNTKSHIALT